MKMAILVMVASMSVAAEQINIIEMTINDEEIYANLYARYFDLFDFDAEEALLQEAIDNATMFFEMDEEEQ
jgi:hypothetical protein